MPVPAHEEPPPLSRNTTNTWGPYSGPGDFSTSMVIILATLLCTLLFALIIVAFIRLILSNRRNRLIISSHNNNNDHDKHAITSTVVVEDDVAPTLTFSAGTKLAGVSAGAECAICLNEFADGDGVRVLPACNHGFHVKCIEGWLVSHSSCPTCRRSCRAPVDLMAEKSSMEMV